MVRITVDAMREKCLNPTWSQCTVITKSVVDKYPGSFEDRTDEGDRMGNGYFTLSSQLKNRVDNLNRNNTLPVSESQKDLLILMMSTQHSQKKLQKLTAMDA